MSEPPVDAVCVICARPFSGWGNNAAPVKPGRCCDDCNLNIVIPTRIAQARSEAKK